MCFVVSSEIEGIAGQQTAVPTAIVVEKKSTHTSEEFT